MSQTDSRPTVAVETMRVLVEETYSVFVSLFFLNQQEQNQLFGLFVGMGASLRFASPHAAYHARVTDERGVCEISPSLDFAGETQAQLVGCTTPRSAWALRGGASRG
jgi:hypothetical protein